MFILSEEEKREVKTLFPNLEYFPSKRTWEGELSFNATYEGYTLSDCFNVRILIPLNYPYSLPLVSEYGGRIIKIREEKKLKHMQDLHYNPATNSICLCAPHEEKIKFPPGSRFTFFLENLVIPYFFALSFFEKNDRWPWGDYSHGATGLFEYYYEKRGGFTREDIVELTKQLNFTTEWKIFKTQKLTQDSLCICGSKEKISTCHTMAFLGMKQLISDSLLMHIPT